MELDEIEKLKKGNEVSAPFNDAFIVLDKNGLIRQLDEKAFLLLGSETPPDLSYYTFIKRDNSKLDAEELPWNRTIRNGKPAYAEIGLCRPDSEITWLGVSTEMLRHSGQYSGILVRLGREEKPLPGSDMLIDSELGFRTLFENLTADIHVWKLVRDENNKIKTWSLIYANRASLDSWGKGPIEELTGKTTDEIFGPGSTMHYMQVVEKIYSDGLPYSFEDYFPNLDKYFNYTSIPMGEYFINSGDDVTTLKKLQQESERQHTELEAVINSTHDSIIVYNMEGEVVLVNKAFLQKNNLGNSEHFIKNSRKILRGFSLYSLEGEQVPFEEWPFRVALRGETIVDKEYKIINPNGKEFYLSFNGAPVYNSRGNQILAMTLTRDITQQKTAEIALRKSEERFRTLADNIASMVWIIDQNGRNSWVNKRFYEYTGLTSEDLISTGGIQVHHPDYIEKVNEKFQQALRSGSVYEDSFPLKGMDGNYRWFLTRAVPIYDRKGDIKEWFGTNTDITEHKKILEALQESQVKFQRAEELAKMGSFVHDLRTGIVDASAEFWKIFSMETADNKDSWESVMNNVHPEDFEKIKSGGEINIPGKPFEIDFRIIARDGSVKYIYLYDASEADEKGNVIKRYGAVMDITESKNAELKLSDTLMKLQESQAKLLNSQRMAKMGNVEYDVTTGRISWSDEVFGIYERSPESGAPGFEEAVSYIHPDDKQRVIDAVTNAAKGDKIEIEYRILLPGGRIKHLVYYMTPRFRSGVQVKRVGTLQDITDRKLMELKLQDTLTDLQVKVKEKEVLLRELYHRIKNNMQIISSLLNLRAGNISNPADRNAFLEMKNRIQAMSLVHEKLYQSKNLSQLNLGVYIRELSDLLLDGYTDTARKISLHYNLADVETTIDTAMPCGFIVTELMLNIIKYAFPGERKGNINISLSRTEEHGIELLISDDGIGIQDPKLINEDKLGLQLVKALIEDQLGGNIVLEATKGTCWRIRFRENTNNKDM